MRFEFATTSRIIFGRGVVRELPPMAAGMGRYACVVTGKDARRSADLVAALHRKGIETRPYAVPGEPTTATIREGTDLARRAGCELVIAMGGGSVLDAGKAMAALLTNRGDLFDYLEIVGKGQPLQRASAPCIAVPTTAGTGAEVTRNAVIGSTEHHVKVSMRSPLMLPSLAMVDPLLTVTMPPSVTAFTGLDALTQLIEAFVSNRANPLTDGICREGMTRAGRSLATAFGNGADLNAREDMALASLFGGLALANGGLGAVHGFAAPIGGMFSAPHGAVCGRLLPRVVAANIEALERRDPSALALSRYDEIAQILTGTARARAQDGIFWLEDLCGELAPPPLRTFSMKPGDFQGIVNKAQRASSMRGNPIALTDQELLDVLEKAF